MNKKNKITRKCPECNEVIEYKRNSCKNRAERKKSLCKSCSKAGFRNGFFKKTHSKESMEKMLKTKETSESYKRHLENIRSFEYRKKLSVKLSGENNPSYGRGTLKDVWTKKYGEEEAERRDKEWKEKLRKVSVGEKNNMFGRPAPVGSGNGWSGWYNGWYFRSLRELSYMINEIEKNNFKWESGEKKKYKIKYEDWNGDVRNYFSDFIIENTRMIECKPESLHESKSVKSKIKAAEKFCKKNGLTFEIVEPKILSEEKIKELYLSGRIKFLDRYEKKFKEKYLK